MAKAHFRGPTGFQWVLLQDNTARAPFMYVQYRSAFLLYPRSRDSCLRIIVESSGVNGFLFEYWVYRLSMCLVVARDLVPLPC
jgi:hypothetical protein